MACAAFVLVLKTAICEFGTEYEDGRTELPARSVLALATADVVVPDVQLSFGNDTRLTAQKVEAMTKMAEETKVSFSCEFEKTRPTISVETRTCLCKTTTEILDDGGL